MEEDLKDQVEMTVFDIYESSKDYSSAFVIKKTEEIEKSDQERIKNLEDELVHWKKLVERNDAGLSALYCTIGNLESRLKSLQAILNKPGIKIVYDNGTLEIPPRLIDRDL